VSILPRLDLGAFMGRAEVLLTPPAILIRLNLEVVGHSRRLTVCQLVAAWTRYAGSATTHARRSFERFSKILGHFHFDRHTSFMASVARIVVDLVPGQHMGICPAGTCGCEMLWAAASRSSGSEEGDSNHPSDFWVNRVNATSVGQQLTVASSVFSKGETRTTSKKDASKASKLLRTSKSKAVRSVAGSDLSQAKAKPKPKKR
jgi:hypothetical protein